MIDKKEFWDIVLNGHSVTQIAAYFVLMVVGIIFHLTLDVRKTMNLTGSRGFRPGFLIKDNPFRWLGIIILVFVSLIFYEDINGQPLTSLMALMLGYNIDSLVGHGNHFLKTKKNGY